MGSNNRHGIMHESHYSPWLFHSINALRSRVGHTPLLKTYFGSNLLGDAHNFNLTSEKSGISPISSQAKANHNMLNYDPTVYFTSEISKPPSQSFLDKQAELFLESVSISRISENDVVLQLSSLPVTQLPSMYYASFQFLYRYLSKCQGTKFAVTAIHTPQEKALFNFMLYESKNTCYSYLYNRNGTVNFDMMSAVWSGQCSPTNYIYYKTPEHLSAYYNIIEDRKKYRDSVALNSFTSTSVRQAAQSPNRSAVFPNAKRLKNITAEKNYYPSSYVSTSSTVSRSTIYANIAPRPQLNPSTGYIGSLPLEGNTIVSATIVSADFEDTTSQAIQPSVANTDISIANNTNISVVANANISVTNNSISVADSSISVANSSSSVVDGDTNTVNTVDNADVVIRRGNNKKRRKKNPPPSSSSPSSVRQCQLCQRYSPYCKGSSRPPLCQFKCHLCANEECPRHYGNDVPCHFPK